MTHLAAEIKSVIPGSIAEEIGLEPGDVIEAVNGIKIKDVLDYRYLMNDEFVTITVRTRQGSVEDVEIEKDDYEDLGAEFENSLMDKAQRCANKCIFCFIDQLPDGMRSSLYFKDDDTRLSFFQGNYVTLTNLSDEEIDRLIHLRVSPVNISVQTTNPELRVKMLKNPRAARIMEYMRKFAAHNIEMNCQIVLCPGFNDGAELQRTIFDCYSLYPHVKSVAVVPVGLTKHRKGLCDLQPVDKEKAEEILAHIHFWQDKFREETGTGFVYAADELYLKAELPVPSPGSYDGYSQLENGVGLIASLFEDLDEALKEDYKDVNPHSLSIATGAAAYDSIKKAACMITAKYPQVSVNVIKIINDFFGDTITVVGLLCGCDIIRTLKGRELGDYLLITDEMLRSGSETLLDDTTVSAISKALKIPVHTAPRDGFSLVRAVLDK